MIMSLSLIGCKPKVTEETTTAKEYTINVVVHGGITDLYWMKAEKGAKDAGKLYPEVEVKYSGPEVYDFPKFYTYLETAIADKPDGLICTMTNPEAMDELLRNAIANGLTIIAIDSPDSRPANERIPYLAYFGETPYQGGVLAAREILKRYTPKSAIYGNNAPGATNMEERGKGFADTLAEVGIPFEALDVTADSIQGAEILVNYVKAHPDVDTAFIGNNQWAEGFVVRLEEIGKKPGEDIKIVTFAASPTTIDMLEQKKILFALDEQPYLQGYDAVTSMYLYLKYGFMPPELVPTLGLFPEDISKLRELVAQNIR